MIFTRATGILILILGICLMNDSALADNDAMIDIDNHTATFTGTWTNSTNKILYYGDNYRYAVCNGNDSPGGAVTAEATFSSQSSGITVDITGRYAVYVRWVTHPNRTDSARYRIYSGSTQVGSCTVNQEQRGGEWVFCNEVTLNEGDSANVKLGNNCELNQIVVADAVRFVRVSKDKDDIVDEPGADWDENINVYYLTSTHSTVMDEVITVPTSGTVIVTATAYCYLAGSGNDQGLCQVTTDTTVNLGAAYVVCGDGGLSNGIQMPIAQTRGFDVSAGSTTFRFVCYETTGDARIARPSITAIFVPTEY